MGLFKEINKKLAGKKSANTAVDGKVLAFINQKGGVGKTTMAYNTAFGLAKRGHKVLCLDLDPQSNLSLLFDIEVSRDNCPHIHQMLVNSVRELKALHVPILCDEAIIKGEVDLIPAAQALSGFELTVSGISSPRQLILKKFIEKNNLNTIYDYIVVDCPPTLGLLVVNILCAAQGILIPFRPDEFSRKGLEHFYEVLADIEEMDISQCPQVLAHIPNLVDIRRKQEEINLVKIEADLNEGDDTHKVVKPFYNRAQLVKSQAQKKSVYHYHGKEYSQLQAQFNELVDIIEQWQGKKTLATKDRPSIAASELDSINLI